MGILNPVFIVGGIWVYIISLICLIAIIYMVEREHAILPGISLICYFVFFKYAMKSDAFGYILNHPILSLLYALGYLILGFLWSFVKWWSYVNKESIRYKNKRYTWLKDLQQTLGDENEVLSALGKITLDTKVPGVYKQSWLKTIIYVKPDIETNKNKITTWIIYWPFSVVWVLLNDFICKITKMLINKFRSLYDLITKKAFKNLSELDNE